MKKRKRKSLAQRAIIEAHQGNCAAAYRLLTSCKLDKKRGCSSARNVVQRFCGIKRKSARRASAALGAPPVPEAARIALAAAKRTKPAGRFGRDRAFISSVWSELTSSERDAFDGDIDEFKESLLKAQRQGLLALARADMPGAMNPRLVKGSEIRHLNSLFHFIAI